MATHELKEIGQRFERLAYGLIESIKDKMR